LRCRLLAAASGVNWKPGKDVTVKVMKKKPKPGSKSSGKPQTKTEPVESFFRWFTEVPEVCERKGQGTGNREPGAGQSFLCLFTSVSEMRARQQQQLGFQGAGSRGSCLELATITLPVTLPRITPLPLPLPAQIPDEDEEEGLTQEEMEALEEDMQGDFEIAEMIK